eukprot:TRINITY_DN1863_c0_g1_i3.p1 TRINITY_DN1863_c0_g1~~TRINITY_DN1863_c0_g1_i3.p1  ORF type:complete len:161 (-),score=26.32 TRINITY_DN1863_c0_g1_i3:53-535(-)
MLHTGLVPLLHGDVVLDATQGCCILSGDTLIQGLAWFFKPERCVFVTDVHALYDTDPKTSNQAKLVQEVSVTADLEVSMSRVLDHTTPQPTHTPLQATPNHDVTGGMKAKIQSAISICRSLACADPAGDVLIVGVFSPSLAQALMAPVHEAEYATRIVAV